MATIAPSTSKDPGLSLSGTSKRSGGKRKSLVNEKLYVPLPDEGEMELMRQVGLVKATFWGCEYSYGPIFFSSQSPLS